MNLQQAKNFLGIELKERSVRVLFKKCLPTEGTARVEEVRLFTKMFGYPKDQDPIYLDADKLEENKEEIRFLFGQLKAFHDPESSILRLEDAVFRYDGVVWAADKETVMKLLYLGAAESVSIISPLKAPEHYAYKSAKLPLILTPSDPDYYTWLKAYKEDLIARCE